MPTSKKASGKVIEKRVTLSHLSVESNPTIAERLEI